MIYDLDIRTAAQQMEKRYGDDAKLWVGKRSVHVYTACPY